MYLSEKQSTRFYRLFFGLLRFVNERYGINDDPLYGTYEITNPSSVKEVSDVLWNKDDIIDDYLKENPNDLTLIEKGIVSSWRSHITSQFILHSIDEGYSIFIADSHAFGVSGVACEISEVVNIDMTPGIVETTLIPYDGKIIYDTIMLQKPIIFGKGMLDMFRDEYDMAINNGGIITDASRFISVADECALHAEEDAEASDGATLIPDIDELKSELEERLQINVETFSIRDDIKMKRRMFLFGDETEDAFDDESEYDFELESEDEFEDEFEGDLEDEFEDDLEGGFEIETEDETEELSILRELMIAQYSRNLIYNAMKSFCLKPGAEATLYNVLKNQRVSELKIVAKNFYITNISKLKKDELIGKIIDVIKSDEFVKEVLFSADEDMEKLLATIAKDGYVKYSELDSYYVLLKHTAVALFLCIYEESDGYTFKAPDEILEYMRKYTTPSVRRKYALYRGLSDYASAFTNLYGMVHFDDFVRIYNTQEGGKLTRSALLKNLLELIDEGFGGDIDIYDEYVINAELSDEPEYTDYLEERHKTIGMFPASKDELLNYIDPYYYEETDEAKILYAYITRELLSEYDDIFTIPVDFLEELHDYARKSVAVNEIMELVDEYEFPVEESEQFIWIGLIYAVLNSSRKWANNGWTPRELCEKQRLEMEAAKEKNLPDNVISFAQKKAAKIGRNDPCPCGSGKKYKHCCGKNR